MGFPNKSEEILKYTPEAILRGIRLGFQEIPGKILKNPERISEGIPERILVEISGDIPEGISRGIQGENLEEISGVIPE